MSGTPHVLTEAQRELIMHALRGGKEHAKPYRNHFAATFDTDDYREFAAMEALGLVERGRSIGYGCYFHITPLGAECAGTELPRP